MATPLTCKTSALRVYALLGISGQMSFVLQKSVALARTGEIITATASEETRPAFAYEPHNPVAGHGAMH